MTPGDIPLWKQISFERDLRRLILHRVSELIDDPVRLRNLIDRLMEQSKSRKTRLSTLIFPQSDLTSDA